MHLLRSLCLLPNGVAVLDKVVPAHTHTYNLQYSYSSAVVLWHSWQAVDDAAREEHVFIRKMNIAEREISLPFDFQPHSYTAVQYKLYINLLL